MGRACTYVQLRNFADSNDRGQRGLDEIEQIAAVDGVDLIALGPTDICAALGITDPSDPRLRQTFQELVAKVKVVGKAKAYVPVNHSALRFFP